MAKGKSELLSKAPWRGDDYDEEAEKFKDAKMKVTSQPGSTPAMHVPRQSTKSQSADAGDDLDDPLQIDPELRYSFQRNFQFLQRVFSIDTIVKPLPPAMAYNASRNLSFFTRIFTQFFNPEGIANAQKSLGLGQEEKDRRVYQFVAIMGIKNEATSKFKMLKNLKPIFRFLHEVYLREVI